MKNIYILITILVIAQASYAQDNTIAKQIKFLEYKLTLKENKGNEKAFIAEYIPANETFENWTSLFAVRFLPGKELSSKNAALQTAENIKKRKENGDIYANSMVFESKDGNSVAIDFLISDNKVLEHNLWRYFKSKNGMISYQFARRLYAKDPAGVTKFLKDIPTLRSKLLNELSRKDLPLPKFN